MLFLERQVHFLELLDLADQRAPTIAGYVSPVIQKLTAKNLIVTAVCTDNASNEKAILNPDHDYSLQAQTGLPLLRLPCLGHTVNLAMHDFFNASSPSILDGLHEVFRSLPHFPGSEFHAMPRINEGRWFSVADLVYYLFRNASSIEKYLSEKCLRSAHSTFITLGIPELNQVLQQLSTLIRTLEANSAVYSDAFLVFTRILLELHSLTTNRYQKNVSDSLMKRFTSTADFSLIVATFLLTPRGVAHMRTLKNDNDYAIKLQEQAEQGLSQLCAIFRLPQHDLVEIFRNYLWKLPIPAHITSASQLWA
jgi:hypothetical protein